jgi:hypothetical protein
VRLLLSDTRARDQTGTGKTELLQRQHGKPAGKAQVPKHFANTKFSEHPTQHYVPINVSPLGTDALFVGKRPLPPAGSLPLPSSLWPCPACALCL